MRRLILSMSLLLFSLSAWAQPPKGYPFVSFDVGLAQAKQLHKKMFVYFGRYGCGYCEKVNRETFSNADLRALYVKNYVLVYVDSESGDRLTLPDGESISEMNLGARLNVIATPVFLYMSAEGKTLLQAPGYKTVKDFTAFDRYIQGGFYQHENINSFLKSHP